MVMCGPSEVVLSARAVSTFSLKWSASVAAHSEPRRPGAPPCSRASIASVTGDLAGEIVPNFYETLGVGVDASPEVIQRVYRQLAKAYHPDTNPDNPAGAEKLKNLSEAYETLKDPARRRRYDRTLNLGASGAARPRPPQPERAARPAARHEAEQASRRRAEEERRVREVAARRRAAAQRKAEEERRRRDEAQRRSGPSVRTRTQAARERLQARKTALAHAIAYFAGRELEDRVTTHVGFSRDRGWLADGHCFIRSPEDPGLSLGPRDEILTAVLTGTVPEIELFGDGGRSEEHLAHRLRAHERYLAEAGTAARNPDALLRSGALWLTETEGAFRAAVWAASCAARTRACERAVVQAALGEERRQRRLRAMNPVRRWLHTPPAVSSEIAARVPRARAALERQVRILRREYPAQIDLLRTARDPLLDGFFEQCLLLTCAAAECVAAYVSAAEGSIAELIDERVARLVEAARGAEAM